MRLQKYMARSGVASRRKSEEIILEGRVSLNDEIVMELGTKVEKGDLVRVDGKLIRPEEEKIYIVLNKPVGYTTTLKDRHSKRKVIDLIDNIDERIYPVGRLDEDTEGLLLMTNDGDLTYRLTHPSYEVVKVYIAEVEGKPEEKDLDIIRRGIMMDGSITAPARVKLLSRKSNSSILQIEIHEGRNRQVRRMCDYIGHPVINLKRIALGDLDLGNLSVGSWRYLNEKELEGLKKEVEV